MSKSSSLQVDVMNIGKTGIGHVVNAGDYNLAGVYLGGMRDTTALEEVFFQNPSFGVQRRNNQMFRTIGCDYCFWTIHFRNRFGDYNLQINILTFYLKATVTKQRKARPSNLNQHRQPPKARCGL